MRKFSLLTLLLLMTVFVSAQTITVKFTAEDQNGNYCPFDAVKVTNISQNWNQTLAYPDTILILNYTDGVSELSDVEGLTQNNPNPFKGTTEATLTLAEAEQAIVQVFDIKGKVLLEFRGNLAQGEHVIKVTLAEPQMVLLRVHTSRYDHVVKMLNIGRGGSNHIEINDLAQHTTNMTKSDGLGPFTLGDVLSYTGVKMQDAVMVLSNNTITQAQYSDEVVTFVFDVETPVEPQLPIVVTRDVSDITSTTAVCGGEVISDGGDEVITRGVCWSITPNPSINDEHTNDGSGLGEFLSSLVNLESGTNYYVRAYAINSIGIEYGEVKTFTTSIETQIPEGALNGLFSVSATKQVYFSQGNLQYQASTNIWRFAENQWDYVGSQTPISGNAGGTVSGSDNANISSTYDGWIDLFGWGTGNNPTNTSTSDVSYSSFVDWGIEPISNGGNQANLWRTLTNDEWIFLLFGRTTSSGIRFVMATVNDIIGLIVLPDDWSLSYYSLNNANTTDAAFSSNIITSDNWKNKLEVHGAVFLPPAGNRFGASSIYGVGNGGGYWLSTPASSTTAYHLYLYEGNLGTNPSNRYNGLSVRLVAEE